MIFIVWTAFVAKQRESDIKVCENKDFCNIVMPFEDTKILEFSQYQKTDKALFIILGDLEYLIEKINECKTKPGNSSTATLGKLIHQDFQCLQYHHLKA